MILPFLTAHDYINSIRIQLPAFHRLLKFFVVS